MGLFSDDSESTDRSLPGGSCLARSRRLWSKLILSSSSVSIESWSPKSSSRSTYWLTSETSSRMSRFLAPRMTVSPTRAWTVFWRSRLACFWSASLRLSVALSFSMDRMRTSLVLSICFIIFSSLLKLERVCRSRFISLCRSSSSSSSRLISRWYSSSLLSVVSRLPTILENRRLRLGEAALRDFRALARGLRQAVQLLVVVDHLREQLLLVLALDTVSGSARAGTRKSTKVDPPRGCDRKQRIYRLESQLTAALCGALHFGLELLDNGRESEFSQSGFMLYCALFH